MDTRNILKLDVNMPNLEENIYCWNDQYVKYAWLPLLFDRYSEHKVCGLMLDLGSYDGAGPTIFLLNITAETPYAITLSLSLCVCVCVWFY
jgi:hypothetical protein